MGLGLLQQIFAERVTEPVQVRVSGTARQLVAAEGHLLGKRRAREAMQRETVVGVEGGVAVQLGAGQIQEQVLEAVAGLDAVVADALQHFLIEVLQQDVAGADPMASLISETRSS